MLGGPHVRALIETHDEVGQTTTSGSNDRGVEDAAGERRPSEERRRYRDIVDKFLPDVVGMGGGETYRMVGLRRKAGEPLGLTVQLDDNENLTVARILEGGMIEKQKLLHVGDVILEVNGVEVFSAEDLQIEIARSKDSVTLKVGQVEASTPDQIITHAPLMITNGGIKNVPLKKHTCFMRALFEYNPEEDTLLPCKEIGLHFDRGDILHIVDQRDPNWWQAKHAGTDGPVGLVPSLELEERRKAYVHPEADYVHKISICGARISKKKKKSFYQSKSSTDFDKAELLLYEEVTRMPPFKRKTLVLVGTQGVGRRTLKNRLINSDPEKFGAVIPWTTREPRVLEEDGQSYWFKDRFTFDDEIKKNQFLEYGDYNGNIYGTHLNTIRDVIKQGKMCVLDSSPASLKFLHHSTEFLPFVIFIAAPGMEQLKNLYDIGKSSNNVRSSSRNLNFERQSSIRYSSTRARTLQSLASLYEEEDLKRTLEDSASMQRTYDQYIDLVVTNNDFDSAFREIVEALEALTTEHQWVPVNWIY